MVISDTWNFYPRIDTTTFVAELGIASVASHVIASRCPLDVHPAHRTFLAVGVACFTFPLCPVLELPVSFLESFARQSLVPGGVALEAPLKVARGASQFDVLLFQPELSGQLVFRDEAAARARLLAAVTLGVDQEAIVLFLQYCVAANQIDHLVPGEGLRAFRIRTFDVRDAVVDGKANHLRHAVFAHGLPATGSLGKRTLVGVAQAHRARGYAGRMGLRG